jgi:drug/metabolite transporter (DMT)-like permease
MFPCYNPAPGDRPIQRKNPFRDGLSFVIDSHHLMKLKHWLAFILLGVVWSASFLWIKIAVQEVGPFTLVGLRVVIGALTGILATIILRTPWPRDRATWITYIILGLTSVAIPFVLISWGEKTIDSAVASILNASVPLFTIVLAHYTLRDDRMTAWKILGLLVGFGGVVVLLSKDLQPGGHNSILGQAAVIIASLFYAGSSVFARAKTEHVPGLVRGAAPLLTASVMMWAIIPLVEKPVHLPTLPITWVALVWLGALGSGLAFFLWYYLLHEIGPTRATLVSYLFPLGGVILGVIFLSEELTWQLFLGALLIVLSIVLVNWRPGATSIERR